MPKNEAQALRKRLKNLFEKEKISNNQDSKTAKEPSQAKKPHPNGTAKTQKRSADAEEPLGNTKKPKLIALPSSEETDESDDDWNSLDQSSSEDSDNDVEYDDDEEEEDEELDMSDNERTYESWAHGPQDGFDYSCSSSYDEDYELPADVPEDTFIAQGTAVMRPLSANAEINFDSDNEDGQIIEMSVEVVKSVQQLQQYDREELLKLNSNEYMLEKTNLLNEAANKKHESNSDSDCPQLVPIDDELSLCGSDEDLSSIYERDNSVSVDTDYNSSDDYADYVKRKYLPPDSAESDDSLLMPASDSAESDVYLQTPEACYVVANEQSVDNGVSVHAELDTLENESASIENASESKPWDCDYKSQAPDSVVIAIECGDDESIAETPQTKPSNDDGIGTETAPDTTTFRTLMFNGIDCNNVLVLLKDTINLYGTVRLTLLAGAVEIYGYSPKPNEEIEIFSPRGCCAVGVTPSTDSNTESTEAEITAVLKQVERHFLLAELHQISELYVPQTDALFLLKRNCERKKVVLNLKKYMSENIFPSINVLQSGTSERPHYASELLLHCIINKPGTGAKSLQIPNTWRQLPVKANSKCLIAGGKGVGKSTLLRTLINRQLLQQPAVLLIDLDIGQPEVFVPQTISCTIVKQPLLGPGFFLNSQPEKAFVIGQSNIMTCPQIYMRAVKQLLRFCRMQENYAKLPWYINTMGYNKGFGLELLAILCEFVQPTDVIQLQSKKDINNFDVILHPEVLAATPRCIFPEQEFKADPTNSTSKFTLHILDAAVTQESRYKREWEMSAKDMRYTMILARLSSALHGNAEWLSDSKPLSVSIDSVKVINMAGLSMSQFCLREDLLQIIEANLVYLCRWQSDEPLECFGIGIVRAVDRHIGQIYLLPAMPHERMLPVDCLVIGEIPLPTSLLTNQGPKVRDAVPFVFNTTAANSSKSIKQIFHRPPEFLTGKHKELKNSI